MSVALGADLPPLHLPAFASAFSTFTEIEGLESFASQAVVAGHHLSLLGCDVEGPPDRECLASFVEALGLRLFRRPIADDEAAAAMAFYDGLFTSPDVSPPPSFREAVDAVARVLLQSPQFLYRHEAGAGPSDLAGLRALSSYERASRLSFFLWESGPDALLLRSAAAGDFDSVDGMRAHAERMLADPRAEARIRRFASHWLGLDGTERTPPLEERVKSSTAFPFDSPDVRSAMRDEVESLYARVLLDGDGSFGTLFTSREAKLTPALAALYGVPAQAKAGDPVWVTLPNSERAGLFTRAAFLANFSGSAVTSPIARGVHLSREVLCQPIGDPPGDVNDTPALPWVDSEVITTREAATRRTAAPGCQGCHRQVNPLGFAFEHYDAMGVYREVEVVTTDAGVVDVPIDAAATTTTPGFEVTVADAVALSDALAKSEPARRCHVRQWFEVATARTVAAEDACTIHRLDAAFTRSGDLRALLIDLAVSAPMRLVRPPADLLGEGTP